MAKNSWRMGHMRLTYYKVAKPRCCPSFSDSLLSDLSRSRRCTAVLHGLQRAGASLLTYLFLFVPFPRGTWVTLRGGKMSFDPPLPPYTASDPHASFLNSTTLDLLLIEIVPLAHRLANELSVANGPLDDEEEREAMFYRLETLGYRVGQGLVERRVDSRRFCSFLYAYFMSRFSRDRTRMVDTLDVIKFICKDLWTIVFRKQIDNLKTNHRVCYYPQFYIIIAILTGAVNDRVFMF